MKSSFSIKLRQMIFYLNKKCLLDKYLRILRQQFQQKNIISLLQLKILTSGPPQDRQIHTRVISNYQSSLYILLILMQVWVVALLWDKANTFLLTLIIDIRQILRMFKILFLSSNSRQTKILSRNYLKDRLQIINLVHTLTNWVKWVQKMSVLNLKVSLTPWISLIR